MTKVGISVLLLVLMFWVRERRCADDDDGSRGFKTSEFRRCGDRWNSRYPWLVEVRFTRERLFLSRRFHNSRHGVLLTPYVVLTRGHDLEGYPSKAANDMVPIPKSPEACHHVGNVCIYANIRRPINERGNTYTGQYCGENALVKNVITHPKFGTTADVKNIFSIDGKFKEYKKFLMNLKYAFAIAVLMYPFDATNPTQTFIPTVILPRTPLDFLYLLRRVDTLGPESKLCEFPTFDGLKYTGDYTPYNKPDKTVIRLRQPQYRDLNPVICPGDFGLHAKGYEGSKGNTPKTDRDMQVICNKTMINGTAPISFLAWTGPWATLDFATPEDCEIDGFDSNGRLKYSTEMLGAPVVCDGTLIGITATWHGRGRSTGLADLFIGTTWFRVYQWIITQMDKYSNKYFHRYNFDDPFLWRRRQIHKVKYPYRKYDKSVFDLSINEPIAVLSGSQIPQISIFAIFLPLIIIVRILENCKKSTRLML